MLEIRNLTKIYKSKSGVSVTALDNISLTFPKTGMVFILGKSGSGKSTLLNVIGGLDNYDSGKIFIKGESTDGFKQSHFDSYRNTYIGFIFQDYNILDGFTVGANIGLAMELQGKKADSDVISNILHEVELDGLGNRKPNELSGGQKQRVAIARALVKQPRIIMADEPTGALDSVTGRQVFDTLKKLSQDKLVLIVSHDREFAEGYADRIIELKDGKVISDVSKDGNNLKEEDVEYGNDTITVKQGYQLTKEDLDKINEYLSKVKHDTIIETSKGRKSRYVFKDTDQNFVDVDTSGFNLIKSSLSIKNSFKIGSSSLKHKVFRLIVTIFLSIQAFTLFGLADTIAAYSKKNTTITSIVDSNITYSTLAKYQVFENNDYYDSAMNMEQKDVDFISSELGALYKGVYSPKSLDLSFSDNYGDPVINDTNQDYYSYLSNYFVLGRFEGLVEFSDSELKEYGFNMLGGKLPSNKNEIAISDYTYNLFNILGIKNEEGKTINVSSCNDIIGKEIEVGENKYTISGILDTQFDMSRYEDLLKLKRESDTGELIYTYILAEELRYAQEYSLINTMIVKEGFIDELINTNATSFVSPNKGNLSINKYKKGDEERLYTYFSAMSNVSDFKGDIAYFGSNKTIDSTHIVVTPLTLARMSMYATEEVDREKIASLNKTITIDDVDYSSFTYAEMLNSSYYYSSDSMFILYNEIIKGIMDLYENHNDTYQKWTNIFGPFEQMVSEVVPLVIDSYRLSYTSYGEEKSIIEDYLAKNLYNALILAGANFKEGISGEIYHYYSSGDEKSIENIEIIGMCYNINYIDSVECVVIDDELFNSLATLDKGIYSFAVSSMPTDKRGIAKIYDFTTGKYNKVNNEYNEYHLMNGVSYELDMVDDILEVMQKVFFYVGLFFALFATLLLSNFISTSVAFKKKDIGILRAIGSRSLDVFKIFFAESFIIAMINFVLSVSLTITFSIVINYILRQDTGILVTIMTFSIRQVALLLLISLAIAAIGTFLPVNKVAKKKPIEAIRTANQ